MFNTAKKYVPTTIKKQLRPIILQILNFYENLLDRFRLNSLQSIYKEEYFAKRKKGNWKTDIENISHVLNRYFKPDSVIDVGCGSGVYLLEFQKFGVTKIKGIEGSKSALAQAVVDDIVLHDLRDPIPDFGLYDLVICFEVAEHIHQKYSKTLIQSVCSLCNSKGYIVFSAAVPGQEGTHHVNLKPKEFWINLFKEQKFFIIESKTRQLSKELSQNITLLTFISDNVMVFKHE